MLEVPAGLCEGEDTAEATILREAREEAGLDVRNLQKIGTFLLSPGASDESLTLFAGQVQVPPTDPSGIAGYAGLASEGEDIRVRVCPAAEAIEAAFAGRVPNATTMIALLWLASRREALRAQWSRA
jgi:ADP-ribose pyrophosphatase